MLATLGTLGLLYEIIHLFNESFKIDFWYFIFIFIVLGLICFMIDGFFIKGYLKNKITITINSGRNNINIFFGDLIAQNGWKIIPVNEFFDHLVDNSHVARSSLHGAIIEKYWCDNPEKWYSDIISDLKNNKYFFKKIKRLSGNIYKFEIGATAKIIIGNNKFLFFALSHTNLDNLEAKASVYDLQEALTGLLVRARSCCSGETLNLPLVGAGLSRIGLSYYMLINMMLLKIKEISKDGDITINDINIILNKKLKSKINLETILRTWRDV